ncbi:MAG: hypothetical protein PGN07_11010 [Aeromicrobium erythreum]
MTEPGRDESVVIELRPAPWREVPRWPEVVREVGWLFLASVGLLLQGLTDLGTWWSASALTVVAMGFLVVGIDLLARSRDRLVLREETVELYRWSSRRARRRLRREHLSACRFVPRGAGYSVLALADRRTGTLLLSSGWEPHHEITLQTLGLEAPAVSEAEARLRVPKAFPWTVRHRLAFTIALLGSMVLGGLIALII